MKGQKRDKIMKKVIQTLLEKRKIQRFWHSPKKATSLGYMSELGQSFA